MRLAIVRCAMQDAGGMMLTEVQQRLRTRFPTLAEAARAARCELNLIDPVSCGIAANTHVIVGHDQRWEP
jgi:hypothetical protein